MIAYHSQPVTRQDEWVIGVLGGKRDGFFVEVGAYDGLRHSNTLTLEQHYGWSGLLIEPDPALYKSLVENRPGCKHSALAISDRAGIEKFAQGGPFGGLWKYLPADWKTEHEFRKTPIRSVKTGRLYTLLAGIYPYWPTIDYLSLDTEGSEYAILADYFAHWYLPVRCMTVEFRYDRSLLQMLESLLEPVGFVLDEVREFDACFIHKRLIK